VAHIIKNYDSLATSESRKLVLSLVEAAFAAIEPRKVMGKHFRLEGDSLHIMDQQFNLAQFERIFLIGFGKGSAGIVKIVEDTLGERLTAGFDIDVVDDSFDFAKVHYTKGTHPLPTQANIDYTKSVLEATANLTEKDLVLVVVCGGGSVLFEAPQSVDLQKLGEVNNALLKSGATISEMNVIRKHLSRVKGGSLAKHLYPATVASLIFSDVPGNDLSVIASAPTVKDPTTLNTVHEVLRKYHLTDHVALSDSDFTESATDDKYFANVHNLMILSNQTALQAMQKAASTQGIEAIIQTDRLQGNALTIGQELLAQAQTGKVILYGGETTMEVTGTGKGGRNQALVLATVPRITDDTIIASFDSDGWDFYGLAGAIGDRTTAEKAVHLALDIPALLDNDDAYSFFQATGDGIDTGKLESNVSDLIIIYRP